MAICLLMMMMMMMMMFIGAETLVTQLVYERSGVHMPISVQVRGYERGAFT